MSIVCDRYTDARLTAEHRARIEAALPPGTRMTLTHGGRSYTAHIYRDTELVARDVSPRPERAAELALCRLPGTTYAVDGAGYVVSIEGDAA